MELSLNQKIRLSVIIVNYNSGTYALDCIKSLFKQIGICLEIIVIDNASKDNSVLLLKEHFGESILLIESTENLGFARANNLAASKACGDFLLILNPDTVIEDFAALKKMVCKLEANPQIGLLGPLIDEPRKNKQVFPRYRYPSSRYLKHTDKFKNLPGKIAWILGACMLLKRTVYEEIKGFDPDYFLYGEDADICLRLRLVGYEIGYHDSVKIIHVSGASELGEPTLDKWLRKKRGVFLFCIKHFDTRDTLTMAKLNIVKSRLYLFALYFKSLFSNKSNASFIDKKHRLQATVFVANEAINQIKELSKIA